MTEGVKHSTDNTAKNCGLNCFMGNRQKKKASQSESFWPKFRRRIKQEGKSMAEYAVRISPAGNEAGKSKSFVLSVSRGGEMIPVKIVSPISNEENTQKISPIPKKENTQRISPVPKEEITQRISPVSQEKNTQKNSVKRRTKEPKAGRRSWVRKAVEAFGFSTKKSLHRKVIQDPPQAANSEIVAVQTATPIAPRDSNQRPAEQPSEVFNFDPRDSNPRPVEKTSEARNAIIPVHNRKARAIDRIQCHVSAPSSPRKGASASSSNSTPPRDDVALLRLTPPRLIKVHRLASTALDSEIALPNSPRRKIQRFDAAIGFSVLIIILFCLVISDKFFAIVCTSIWWYAVPKLRSIGKVEEEKPQKIIPEVKKLLTKSLSNNNIDLQSSEYRKKVIMEGLLQRNHKPT